MIFQTLIIVLIAIIAVYLFEDKVIYAPAVHTYQDSKKILKFQTKDGNIISATYIPQKDAEYTVLINHGNGDDLGTLYSFLHEWKYRNFNVLAYDYPGYGTSTGTPNYKSIQQAAETAYNFLINGLKTAPEKIIIYGHSIGAAHAIELARRKTAAAVILDAPFISAFRLLLRLPILPFDRYNNLKKIKNIKQPLLVIHGTHDRLIPIWHGKKLYKAAKKPKIFLKIHEGKHNYLYHKAGDLYWNTIEEFIHAKDFRSTRT